MDQACYVAFRHSAEMSGFQCGTASSRASRPNGNWIAYCTTGNWLHESKLFVIPAAGGTPRQLAADAGWAGEPIWVPDGEAPVLFLQMVGAK